MQLMTEDLKKAFKKYPLYSQNGKGGDAKVVVKYYLHGTDATWLITEGEPQPGGDWLFRGLVTLGFPDELNPGDLIWEWGSVSLNELKGVRNNYEGVTIDETVWPGKTKVKDLVFDCSLFRRR